MVLTSPRLPLLAGAEPFRFEADGPTACVLVHGFTGTANEVRGLGQHLAEAGISSRGVLLAGHGTSPEAMAQHSYLDWIADVEAALDELLAEGKRVFLGGLSMGGTLALNVAARRWTEPGLAGVVALAAPLEFRDWRLHFLGAARLVMRWHSWGRPDIRDRSRWSEHLAYPRFHLRALKELLKLAAETRRMLPLVHQPLLVMHSRYDHTVSPANARLICAGVSSAVNRLVWLEDSFHVLTLDYDASRVCQEVAGFILEHGSTWQSGASSSSPL